MSISDAPDLSAAPALPMDPDMEAFFVAVALELGTQPGQDYVPNYRTLDLRPMTNEERKKVFQRAMNQYRIAEFMKEHPGAPPALEKVKRMHREAAGGLKATIDESYFWGMLAESYVKWCAQQPGA